MSSSEEMAISARSLGKKFRVRTRGLNPIKKVAHWVRQAGSGETRSFDALKDVNLDIRKGESVALIGVNGSGKSTLLRLISGVTSPTTGSINVAGKLAGLIDLTAGFHGDLTGYENIFLQGRIMGFSRREIFKLLPGIEEFSELDDFLNTPVRHFSSGMFLRLAFSLAVVSQPDILIVDDALAVGDAYFQWKCFQKIKEIHARGATLLFVTHIPEVAATVCDRAVWLHEGAVKADGPSADVIQDYNRFVFEDLFLGEPKHTRHEINAFLQFSRFGAGGASIRNVRLTDTRDQLVKAVSSGDELRIEFDVECRTRAGKAAAYLLLERPFQSVSFYGSTDRGVAIDLVNGVNHIQMRLPGLPLREGIYYASLAIGAANDTTMVYDCHQKVYTFAVHESHPVPAREFSPRFGNLGGKIQIVHESAKEG
jgi:lipopolysaccharide transport system ATP-binding protein